MRSDQDHSACFLPYISNHIHNDSLTPEIKVLECFECGLDATLTRCSGHLFWTQTLSQSAAVVRRSEGSASNWRPAAGLCFVLKTWSGESVRNMDANLSWSDCHRRTASLHFNSWSCSRKSPRGVWNHVLLSRVIIYGHMNKQHQSFTSSTFARGDLWTWGTEASLRTIDFKKRSRSHCVHHEDMCPWFTWYHNTSVGGRKVL